MYNLKNCPISEHEVHLFVYAGTCPEIRCACGLIYSHCDVRDPEELARRWNARTEDSSNPSQDRSDAWYAVCAKLDELGVNRHKGITGLSGVLLVIEGLHRDSQALAKILHVVHEVSEVRHCG